MADGSSFCEVVGNVHLHTTRSDGAGTYGDLTRAAAVAGLDFVIPTDHNVWTPGVDGWRDGVLLLAGEETNDPTPARLSHYLSFGITQDVAGLAGDPQRLIDEVRRQGGFGFIAHPVERAAPFVGQPAFDWEHWEVEGYAGISLWNYMSEFKSYLQGPLRTLWAALFPATVIRGPFPETLELYDWLLSAGRPVALIGASDAHATSYSAGPLHLTVFPYGYLFRTVNLHLLLTGHLSGELEHDRELVYEAMRAGRSFVGYHRLGDPRGFAFTARSSGGTETATCGQEVQFDGEILVEVRAPRRARLRLLKDGAIVAERLGRQLAYRTTEAGVYRVEAYRWAWLRWRGWVFTNPIYVHEC